MADVNAAIVGISTFITALIGLLTWYTGFSSKGKDQAHAKDNASYDNLQEDLVNSRAETERHRKRGDEYMRLLDESELARLKQQADFRERSERDQIMRHEMRTLLRAFLVRIEDHAQVCSCSSAIDVSELRERVKKLDQ